MIFYVDWRISVTSHWIKVAPDFKGKVVLQKSQHRRAVLKPSVSQSCEAWTHTRAHKWSRDRLAARKNGCQHVFLCVFWLVKQRSLGCISRNGLLGRIQVGAGLEESFRGLELGWHHGWYHVFFPCVELGGFGCWTRTTGHRRRCIRALRSGVFGT